MECTDEMQDSEFQEVMKCLSALDDEQSAELACWVFCTKQKGNNTNVNVG